MWFQMPLGPCLLVPEASCAVTALVSYESPCHFGLQHTPQTVCSRHPLWGLPRPKRKAYMWHVKVLCQVRLMGEGSGQQPLRKGGYGHGCGQRKKSGMMPCQGDLS